jgi:hypothetical protein
MIRLSNYVIGKGVAVLVVIRRILKSCQRSNLLFFSYRHRRAVERGCDPLAAYHMKLNEKQAPIKMKYKK